MKIEKGMESREIMEELCRRIKQYRIAYPMTQEELSEKSMVSLSTIKRFEKGEDISALKLIMLLKAIDLEGNLEILVSDQSKRPSVFADNYKPRKRARKNISKKTEWKWGNEE